MNQNNNDLDLNDPMVQKCMAYLKAQMNNNPMNMNMNQMNMNQMNNNPMNMNMNNQMNMNQMNMNQMNMNQMNNNPMNMNMNQMNNNPMNMNMNQMYNNQMYMNQMYNNPMFMNMNRMQMQNMYNYCMNQMPQNIMANKNNVGGNKSIQPNNKPSSNIMNESGNNLKEYLPREDKTIYDSSKNIKMDKNFINIALNASTGLKVIIPISTSSTLEELFKRYSQKVNIPQSALGTKIVFLFGGGKIDPFSREQIGDHFKNGSIITVFDQGGIIGA